MAEKYGTIPKRFTPKWWEYFWDYYKWHTLAAIFAVFFVVSWAYSALTAEKFDLKIVHFGNTIFGDEGSLSLAAELEEVIIDADQNGEKNIELINLELMDEVEIMQASSLEQYNQSLYSKFFLTFGDETTYLYLVDSALLKDLAKDGREDEFFLPIDEWGIDAQKNLPKDMGGDYAISVYKNPTFEKNGCKTDDLCLLLKPCLLEDEEAKAAFESAKLIIQELIQ